MKPNTFEKLRALAETVAKVTIVEELGGSYELTAWYGRGDGAHTHYCGENLEVAIDKAFTAEVMT